MKFNKKFWISLLLILQSQIAPDFLALPPAAFGQDSEWEQYLNSSEQALRDGQPDMAARLFKSAMEDSKEFPLGDPRLEKTLKAYADFNYEYGHYQDAFDLYKHLLKSKRSHSAVNTLNKITANPNDAENNPDTSNTSTTVPDKDIGSKAVFDQPADTVSKPSSQDDPIAIADVLVSLGDCSDALNNGQATHYFEEARALLEKHLPPNDPKIADVLVDLGGSESDNQDYWIAEQRFKNAVAIYENNYQTTKNVHVQRKLVGALEQLANVLSLNNKNGEARKIQDRIVELKGVPDIRPQEPTDIISR